MTTTATPAAAIRAALDWLAMAGNADGVAVVIARAGCRADPADPVCPLALWLRQRTGLDVLMSAAIQSGPKKPSPTPARAILPGTGGAAVAVDLPAVVSQFVRRFDRGSYPDLVRT